MTSSSSSLQPIYTQYQEIYRQQQIVLSFEKYLDLVRENPQFHMRSAAHYLHDAFLQHGTRVSDMSDLVQVKRFQLFDRTTEKTGPIVGGEWGQQEIFHFLDGMVHSGYPSKLLLLHGPNGSSKTSTVESISQAMQEYSHTEAGAVYRFNWVFPADREALASVRNEGGPIGFSSDRSQDGPLDSFAELEEKKISCRIASEFKENPLFLLPQADRGKLLLDWMKKKFPADDVQIPTHILGSGLSKRNQQIFERLLYAYDGDLRKVFRHVQVERFFYSKQYRVGISTVEPQLSIDAYEKQLTLDKNYSNMPSVLHTISFHQCEGSLVDANRGFLEFSDFLKRPVEAFKYLLSSIEKGTVSFPSGIAYLDIVFFATTNDKHLDAFKSIPDFSSFKGRIELITVPYLLIPQEEEKIFHVDMQSLQRRKKFAPHCLRVLCQWACLTRLKQADLEMYAPEYRTLLAKLDPLSKLKLYAGEALQPIFSHKEEQVLQEIRLNLWEESRGMVVYEGRFGASPREVRALLHRAAQNAKEDYVTPEDMLSEIRSLVKDRTVYEFLQFEPREGYHDAAGFIERVQNDYLHVLEHEIIESMSIADTHEYEYFFTRYVNHVVAEIKKEKIWEEATSSYQIPSQGLMGEMEKILQVPHAAEHRNSILSRIGSYRVDHPKEEIRLEKIFSDHIGKIKEHFYEEKRKAIEENIQNMISFYQKETSMLSVEKQKNVEIIFSNLESKFGYSADMAYRCIQFLVKNRKK